MKNKIKIKAENNFCVTCATHVFLGRVMSEINAKVHCTSDTEVIFLTQKLLST